MLLKKVFSSPAFLLHRIWSQVYFITWFFWKMNKTRKSSFRVTWSWCPCCFNHLFFSLKSKDFGLFIFLSPGSSTHRTSVKVDLHEVSFATQCRSLESSQGRPWDKTWVQVVNLGDDSKKQEWGSRESKRRKSKRHGLLMWGSQPGPAEGSWTAHGATTGHSTRLQGDGGKSTNSCFLLGEGCTLGDVIPLGWFWHHFKLHGVRKPAGGAAESGRHLKWEAASRLKLSTHLQVWAVEMGQRRGPPHPASWAGRGRWHELLFPIYKYLFLGSVWFFEAGLANIFRLQEGSVFLVTSFSKY